MNVNQILRTNLMLAEQVGLQYLADFTDADLLQRPHPLANPVNWQLGHLIVSEHQQISRISEAAMPELPPNFIPLYTKPAGEQARRLPACQANDTLASKTILLENYHLQRGQTLRVLESLSQEQLDRPSGIEYAATHAELFNMQAAHWLIHSGQWVVVRRQLGLPVII